MTAPTLILACGNPARGDDALGPRLLAALSECAARHPEWGALAFVDDFQFQVEHCLDLRERRRVLFVDAHLRQTPPARLCRVHAARRCRPGSHALSPAEVLHAWQRIEAEAPPPSWILTLRAVDTRLGATLSPPGEISLARGIARAGRWLADTASLIEPSHPAHAPP